MSNASIIIAALALVGIIATGSLVAPSGFFDENADKLAASFQSPPIASPPSFAAPPRAHGALEKEPMPEWRSFSSFVREVKNTILGSVFLAPFVAQNAACAVNGASNLGGPCFSASCPGSSHNGDWVSKHGTDWGAPGGTPVRAIVNGTIGGGGSCSAYPVPRPTAQGDTCGGATWGWKVYLCGDDGNVYFYVHLTNVRVRAGQSVSAGQQIAEVHPCSPTHTHIAIQDASQLSVWDAFFRNCISSGGGDGGDGDEGDGDSHGDIGIDLPVQPSPQIHRECRGEQCILVEGPGIDQCFKEYDCRESHTVCRGKQCISVPEPGIDECLGRDGRGPCPEETSGHRGCVRLGLGAQCAVVPGAGPDECTGDRECPGFGEAGEGTGLGDATLGGGGSTIGAGDPGGSGETAGDFCGAGGQQCQCVNGSLPVDPSLVKRYNATAHGEPGSGHGWAVCGDGLCAVDLNVGATADEAFQVASRGVPIYSPIDGTVTAVSPIKGPSTGTGSCITISGGSNTAELCHVNSQVSGGKKVTAGEQVAVLTPYHGEFGPHLHFELKINGQWVSGDGRGGTWRNQQAALGCQ